MKMMYLCQARVDNLMFNNKRQVSIPLHPKGWSFLETDYMKTLSIDANNVNIMPNGRHNIILDVELENEELDSLITDLDTDDIISAIGIEEILKTIDISDIICYLENCGYVVQFNN